MHSEIESHSSRQTSAASWGHIQWASSIIILPCPASRPDYRIVRLVASGAESVTNQRPEGLFILRRVADHEPIGANGVPEDQLNRWDRVSVSASENARPRTALLLAARVAIILKI
jgi:hypothetical protein